MLGLGKKHRGNIRALAVNSGGTRCVTGAHSDAFPDRDARVWSLPDLRLVRKLRGHDEGVLSAAWSPSGQYIVTGRASTFGPRQCKQPLRDYGGARVWDANTGEQVGEFGLGLVEVRSLAFSADGRLLLSAGVAGKNGAKNLLQLWDMQERNEISRFDIQGMALESAELSPDGTIIACGGSRPFRGERVPSIGFSSRPVVVHIADDSATAPTLRLFETQSGHEICQFDYSLPVNSVKFSPDQAYLLACGKEYLLWDVASGRQAFKFQSDDSAWANSIDISSDGKHVAIACGDEIEQGRYVDCRVRVWRLQAPKEIATYYHKRPVRRVAFIPGRSLLVAGGDLGELHVWSFRPNDGRRLISWHYTLRGGNAGETRGKRGTA